MTLPEGQAGRERVCPSSPIPYYMRPARLTILLSALLFASSVSAQTRLSIRIGQIDSLQLSYCISELLQPFNNHQLENDPDFKKIIVGVVKNYYAFKASLRELELLSVEVANLKSIYELNIKLSNKGDITDLQLLNSHNSYLSRKETLVAKESEARDYLLELVRLSFMKIEFKDKSHEKKEESHRAYSH